MSEDSDEDCLNMIKKADTKPLLTEEDNEGEN
jgi:hypothetical protein